MGSAPSIDRGRHVSKDKDTVTNLVWALQEHSNWEELAHEGRLLEKLNANQAQYTQLTSHYVLLQYLIQQLGSMSVDNCKACLHIQQLQKRAAAITSPFHRLEADKRLATFDRDLHEGLHAYDNARGAIEWLKAECILQFDRMNIEQEITELAGVEEQGRAKSLKTLQLKQDKLDKRETEQKRQLMAVSMHYHDRNFSGFIEPEDMPGLSATLFSLIDVNKDHRVSADELDRAFSKLGDRIKLNQTELAKLEQKGQGLELQMATLDKDTEEQRKMREDLQVKILRNVEAIDSCTQHHEQLTQWMQDIHHHFEDDGFVNDLRQKLQDLEGLDLPVLLETLLSDANSRDEAIEIGLADCKINLTPPRKHRYLGAQRNLSEAFQKEAVDLEVDVGRQEDQPDELLVEEEEDAERLAAEWSAQKHQEPNLSRASKRQSGKGKKRPSRPLKIQDEEKVPPQPPMTDIVD